MVFELPGIRRRGFHELIAAYFLTGHAGLQALYASERRIWTEGAGLSGEGVEGES